MLFREIFHNVPNTTHYIFIYAPPARLSQRKCRYKAIVETINKIHCFMFKHTSPPIETKNMLKRHVNYHFYFKSFNIIFIYKKVLMNVDIKEIKIKSVLKHCNHSNVMQGVNPYLL